MDWNDLVNCKRKPSPRVLRGASRIYVYPDRIITERGINDSVKRSSKCERGQFDNQDVYSVEQETRRKGVKNGRRIFWFI